MAVRRSSNKSKPRSIRDKVREKSQGDYGQRFNGNYRMFEPESKTYRLVILPYEVTQRQPEAKPGEIWYRRKYWFHRNIGPEEKTYNCLKSNLKPCPVCEDLKQLYEDYDGNKGVIDSIKQKQRELYNIALYEDLLRYLKGKEKLEDIVQLMEIAWHCFGKHLEKEIHESEIEQEYDAFADFQGGKVLKVRFSEMDLPKKGKKSLPVEVDRIDFEDREDLDESEVLAAVYNLDEVLNVPGYEDLRKIYFDIESNGSTHKEQEEPPFDKDESEERKPSRRSAPPKREPEPEPEPEEDKPEPEPEEDEPEPEPEELSIEDELVGMDRKELKTYIKENSLDITVYKNMTDDDVREAILNKLEEQQPEEEPEMPPTRSSHRSSSPSPAKPSGKTSTGKGGCPVKNGIFGKDCGDYETCDTCKLFDKCIEAKEA